VLEEVMIDLMYEVPSQTDVKTCVITEETVLARWPTYAVQRRA
jgi:ATP-dependent Clp protease ATP-binding subunit ClpX